MDPKGYKPRFTKLQSAQNQMCPKIKSATKPKVYQNQKDPKVKYSPKWNQQQKLKKIIITRAITTTKMKYKNQQQQQ